VKAILIVYSFLKYTKAISSKASNYNSQKSSAAAAASSSHLFSSHSMLVCAVDMALLSNLRTMYSCVIMSSYILRM